MVAVCPPPEILTKSQLNALLSQAIIRLGAQHLVAYHEHQQVYHSKLHIIVLSHEPVGLGGEKERMLDPYVK